MRQVIELKLAPEHLFDEPRHRRLLAEKLKIAPEEISALQVLRRSIDARHSSAKYLLTYAVWRGEAPADTSPPLALQDVHGRPSAIIVGSGPAGLFAALRLIEKNIKPVVLERGKSVRERRRDLAAITKRGEVNPDSNYCFGEGGAGTFSDGKLFTRAHKRGSVRRILEILHHFGASPEILYDYRPHIGTNKLPQLVQRLRDTIISCGGEVHFGTRVTDLLIRAGAVRGVRTAAGAEIFAGAVVLAAGHSARDIFEMLQRHHLTLLAKPFAVGVRVEHPQELIDQAQYHSALRHPNLPPAAYSLRQQVENRGVFSFCMCPGGIMCPAATSGDEIVINGWSPSKRNSRFANSGIVVEISPEDLGAEYAGDALAGIRFQRKLETAAFAAGGGEQGAPAQRLSDFVRGTVSRDLPECSYLPGIRSAPIAELFPSFVAERLREALKHFGRQIRHYVTNEAIAVAVESRTSSPVRIPRAKDTLMHPQVMGLFPAGEGGGYAGGIVSAAMDGELVADGVQRYFSGA